MLGGQRHDLFPVLGLHLAPRRELFSPVPRRLLHQIEQALPRIAIRVLYLRVQRQLRPFPRLVLRIQALTQSRTHLATSRAPVWTFCIKTFIPRNLQFTIDKHTDLWYPCACYLESASHTSRVTPPLTLGPSISCSLFVVSKKVISFGIKQIQPLFAKHPGWGCSQIFPLCNQ